ncbi:DUF3099 domain-containing protein [Phycicoccus sonneratiae]|uniref:DUF3099 domain-containing protein n=1 Tax=Phycicoccus sonneratiae TaxID=2807628 RepID=UPI0027DB3955|nr:DUF3099 domain-containing protein [Phycicoccus sonneraticus]
MPTTRHHAPDAQSVTTAAESREADQRARLKHYLVTMSVRTACFLLAIVIDEWYRWVFAAGAIVLPFIAVVAANAVAPRVRGRARVVTPTTDDTPLLTERPFEQVPSTVSRREDEHRR